MELSKTKISVVSSLSSKKMRQKHGLFVAEGEKCSLDMLGSFPLEFLVVTEARMEQGFSVSGVEPGKIRTVNSQTMRKISSLVTPPDVMAVFALPEASDDVPEVDPGKLFLVLDGIQDPGNLGTIIRTADWFGIDTVFASASTVDVFNPKAIQATMGSLRHVKVVYTDIEALLKKNSKMPVYGTLLDGEDLFSASLTKGGFIVMGNEGNGISGRVRELVDSPILIPPYNPERHGESLNVAIATAIVLARFRSLIR